MINNTKNLKLHKFGKDILHPYSSKNFCELLSTFSMIEHLLLWDVFLTDNSDNFQYSEKNIKQWLPQLKGFGFTGGSNQRLSQCIFQHYQIN